MKWFWIILTLINLIALIVFLIRQDFGALPFATFGVIAGVINIISDFEGDNNV